MSRLFANMDSRTDPGFGPIAVALEILFGAVVAAAIGAWGASKVAIWATNRSEQNSRVGVTFWISLLAIFVLAYWLHPFAVQTSYANSSLSPSNYRQPPKSTPPIIPGPRMEGWQQILGNLYYPGSVLADRSEEHRADTPVPWPSITLIPPPDLSSENLVVYYQQLFPQGVIYNGFFHTDAKRADGESVRILAGTALGGPEKGHTFVLIEAISAATPLPPVQPQPPDDGHPFIDDDQPPATDMGKP